jgi:phospholipid/cholesterol/gamma-HCH transport system substrate-binding protein
LNDTKVLEIKVGITILVGLTLFVLGIVWLKGITFKPNTFETIIVFRNTAGLQIGDAVTVSGLKVGKVTDIDLEADSVVVYVSLSNTVTLQSDASAMITSVDFFGGKRIELNTGKSDKRFDLTKRLYGSREPDLTELTSQLREIASDVKGTLEKVDSVLIGVNSFVGDKSVIASLKRAVHNMDSTAAHLKLIVNKSDLKIDSILTRLSASTRVLRNIVQKTDVRLDTTFDNIALVTANIEQVTAGLDSIVSKVRSGEGNLGKMVYDESIYLRLNNAAAQFDSLVSIIRQKGMKVDIKLFGD